MLILFCFANVQVQHCVLLISVNVLRLHYILCTKNDSICHFIFVCVVPAKISEVSGCQAPQQYLVSAWPSCWLSCSQGGLQCQEGCAKPAGNIQESWSPDTVRKWILTTVAVIHSSLQFVPHLSAVHLNQAWNTRFISPGLFWWAQASLHFCHESYECPIRTGFQNKWNIVQI